MKSISKFLVTAAALTISAGAHADLIDFVALATDDQSKEGPLEPNPIQLSNGTWLSVTATGGTPYLDDASGGKPGGLGVCAAYTGDNCNPSSDDNVTIGESLIFSFFADENLSEAVVGELAQVIFRNGDHNTDFLGDVVITTNGVGSGDYDLVHVFNTLLTGTVIEFAWDANQNLPDDISDRDRERYNFYISAVTVPEPGTLALLGLGLLGMGAARRKARA